MNPDQLEALLADQLAAEDELFEAAFERLLALDPDAGGRPELSRTDRLYREVCEIAGVPEGSVLASIAFNGSGRSWREATGGANHPGAFGCEHTPGRGWCGTDLRVYEETTGEPVPPWLCRHDERDRQAALGLTVTPEWHPTPAEIAFEIAEGLRDENGAEIDWPRPGKLILPASVKGPHWSPPGIGGYPINDGYPC